MASAVRSGRSERTSRQPAVEAPWITAAVDRCQSGAEDVAVADAHGALVATGVAADHDDRVFLVHADDVDVMTRSEMTDGRLGVEVDHPSRSI